MRRNSYWQEIEKSTLKSRLRCPFRQATAFVVYFAKLRMTTSAVRQGDSSGKGEKMNPLQVIQYWGFFTQEEVNSGKLLMLDIDLGRKCSLRCPHCFRRHNIVDDCEVVDLSTAELIAIIDQAIPLGLQSLKICGAGEPTEHEDFLFFIREMTQRNIGVAVFTKGHVLGSDFFVREIYKKYGITSALLLCQELFKLKVSFMLNYQSANPVLQDELVGNVKGYTQIRDQAYENLKRAGFNSCMPTRLGLHNAPLCPKILPEALTIVEKARNDNVLPSLAAHMISGKQLTSDFLRKQELTIEQKFTLWEAIYSLNIEQGIQTLAEIEEYGISALPGVHPCNQLACGLYLTLKGKVVTCPGYNKILGDIREESIGQIWQEAPKIWAGQVNCHCPPKDGQTIPEDLYQIVLERLLKKFRG